MTDSESNTFSRLLRKLVGFLWSIITWLQGLLEDENSRATLLKDLGLDAALPGGPPAPIDPGDIDKIEAYLNSDDPDVLAFIEAVDTLATLIDAMEVYITPFVDNSDTQSPAREFVILMLQFATVRIARQNYPIPYTLARFIGLLDELHATHHHLLPEFCSEGIQRAWTPFTTEEDAYKRGDLLFLGQVLTSIGVRKLIRGGELLPDQPDSVLAGWDNPLPEDGDDAEPLPIEDSISGRALTWAFDRHFKTGSTTKLATTWILIPKDHGGPGIFLSLQGSLDVEHPVPPTTTANVPIPGQGTAPPARYKLNVDFPETVSFFLPFSGDGLDIHGNPVSNATFEYLYGDAISQRPALSAESGFWQWLEVGTVGFRGILGQDDISIRCILHEITIKVSSDDPDSFIAAVFPSGGLSANFDLDIGYDFFDGGLFFGSSTKLDVVIPHGKSLGPITIPQLSISLRLPQENDGELSLSARMGLVIKIGGFSAVIDQIGYRMLVNTEGNTGKLGLIDAPQFKFLPPKGMGLTLNTGPVKGAGFLYFDPDDNFYAGVVNLKIKDKLSITVVGLINTGLEARPGYSLLVIGSVEGLTIPFFAGGKITGLGIVFGMHRTMSVDALQMAVKNRTLDAILFPQDPVANAPQLLQALKTFFPVAIDQWVVGITVQASWLSKRMVVIEMGLLYEFPAPKRIVLIGQVAIGLPTRANPISEINFDIVGILDLDRKFLSIDGVVYDSHIAKFVLDGELAVRARWSEDKQLVVAIGGLNPRFRLPSEFPDLKLLSISLGRGDNPRLRGYGYLGFTSNTIQFGIGAEFYVAAGGFSVEADVRFDFLINRSTGRFIGEIDVGASIKFKGRTLAGIRVTGSLEGAEPWCAQGKFRIKICFIKWNKRFREQWGEENRDILQAIDVANPLHLALESPDSWGGELEGSQASVVSVRPPPPAASIDIHPLARFEVRQNLIPLDVEMDVFNNAPLAGERRFSITTATIADNSVDVLHPVREHFAPGQHFDIGQGDDAVTRPSFEPFVAGVRLQTTELSMGAGVATNFDYDEIIVNKTIRRPSYRRNYRFSSEILIAGAERGTVARILRSKYTHYAGIRHQISVAETGYGATDIESATPQTLGDEPLSHSATYTEVLQAIQRHTTANPQTRGRLQVSRQQEARVE